MSINFSKSPKQIIIDSTATQIQQQNKVLQNTYRLLALSMIPTVIGASLGVFFQFAFLPNSPLLSVLLFLGISFGFMFGIQKYKNSGVGVALLLGFTFFMGLMLSRILQVALGFSNGDEMIALAGGGTALIFFVMSAIGNNAKKDFSSLGKFLFIGAVVVMLAMVANIFLQMAVLHLALSVMILGIFSAYIMYDINQIVRGGETNYILATLSVYLDVYNVFVSLLNLLMAFNGERD